jgi:hypothetical protein
MKKHHGQMKTFTQKILLVSLMSAITCGVSLAQSALSALNAVSTKRGSNIAAQAVSIIGLRGQDQPSEWQVVVRDPEYTGRLREYVVRQGRIVREGVLPADRQSSSYTLSPRRVKYDSSQVFVTADKAAKKALIGFDALNYELRNKELSQEPIWFVTLVDQNENRSGELIISAESGAILQRTWYENGRANAGAAAPEQTYTDSRAPRYQRRGNSANAEPNSTRSAANDTRWDKTKEGASAGFGLLRDGVKKVGSGVGGWMQRTFSDDPPPRQQSSGGWRTE